MMKLGSVNTFAATVPEEHASCCAEFVERWWKCRHVHSTNAVNIIVFRSEDDEVLNHLIDAAPINDSCLCPRTKHMPNILKCEFKGDDIIDRGTAELREILNWTMNRITGQTSKSSRMYVRNALYMNVMQ